MHFVAHYNLDKANPTHSSGPAPQVDGAPVLQDSQVIRTIACVIASERMNEPEETTIPGYEDVQLAELIFDRVWGLAASAKSIAKSS
jgi:hypothetical protein